MSTILSVYTQNAFCEYLLPAVDNTDTEIMLKKSIFAFKDDEILKLEVVNKDWYLKNTESYYYTAKNGKGNEALKNGDILTVHGQNGNDISLIVRETENSFSVFRKYGISAVDRISIGSEEGNHIRYQSFMLVSGRHALLKRTSRGFCVEDINSANGTFVNGKRIYGTYELKIGDNINIFGLQIIYLGNMVAIYAPEENPSTVCRELPVYIQDEEGKRDAEKIASNNKEKYFHRSPRNYIKPEIDSIEIEAPPNPKEESKRPLWMVIGPSFTMVIPMLMSSVMAIMSADSNNRNASMYMYTGIITAVGSALIGVYWALANIRHNKKEIRKGEELRFNAYGQYLVKRAEFIREKYIRSRDAMIAMYPPASDKTAYGEDSVELWNRNHKHEDFLWQRIGKGDLPFQMTIQVPKERFTLINDELAERPRLIQAEYSVLYDVPINIDLFSHKLIGVVGGADKKGAYEIVRLLTAQIAANNCYTDVKMVFLYDGNRDQENWEYAKWLPHVWSEDKKTRFVAGNKSEASDVLFELTQVLRMRSEDEKLRAITLPKPYYILFVSDTDLLEGELAAKYIYECEPCYGLTTLILSRSRELLPNECEYLIQKDNEFCGIYNMAQDQGLPVAFDDVTGKELEAFARRLLPIEVREVERGRDIPTSLSFFEMAGIQTLEELDVEEKWRKNRTYENMRALIGVKAGGLPCYLDVHEKYHGPHGLVAGTTGSGKSEVLQTYLLSLAIQFSPDDVGYFVIDYKGGGMAGLFEGLPHLIGSISNLSGNQVRRAMISIKSENYRRQRIFQENNVNNINLYTKLYKNGEASVPVPHLFIIIDEFAELKKEEPEFMKELVSVAQIGRSLGVHLILATQKPNGTVDENISSNAKFRLCLRVQDRQDSVDMLHKPDAAYITQAGRGYLQVGNDEVYELFQSGYSGAAYEEGEEGHRAEIALMLSLSGKAALVGNSLKSKKLERDRIQWVQRLLEVVRDVWDGSGEEAPAFAADEVYVSAFFQQAAKENLEYPDTVYNRRRIEELMQVYASIYGKNGRTSSEEEAREVVDIAYKMHKRLPEAKGKTQLGAVIEYLGKKALEEGYTHRLQLWLPLLPKVIYLNDLKEYGGMESEGDWAWRQGKWDVSAPIGLYDDPVNRTQLPLVVSFSKRGHLAVCGTIVSGKSSLLQTLLFALISRYQPDWLNLYIIDFSSHMLSCFEKAPHVGGVMYEEEPDKIDKFFHMMGKAVEDRKKLFQGGNYAQYVQTNGVKLPTIVIVVDNLGSFREKTESKYDEELLRLAREGIGYGIYLTVTAAGFTAAEISSKMGENFKTVLCLQLNDKFAYTDALRCNHIEVLPENDVVGRGLAVVGEGVLEFQTALSLKAEDDFKRMEEIGKLCERMSDEWGGRRARKIPVIPEKPVWKEYIQLEDVWEMQKGVRYLPIGYDMDSADIYGIDLSRTYSYVVSGGARTGKTNLLKAIICSASKKNGNLAVIEHGATELKATALATGADYIDSKQSQADFFSAILEPFRQRNIKKRRLLEEGKDEEEIFEAMQEEKPYFIVVADIVLFVQSVEKPEEKILDIRKFLENVAEKGKLHNVYFFLGVNPDTVGNVAGSKLCSRLMGYRTGIYMGGNVTNFRYFDFSDLPYMEQSKVWKAGVGLVPAGGENKGRKVVVPIVKG